MPAVTVMLKPASGMCNLRCKYCFYTDETAHRAVPSYGMMKYDVLEAVLRKILEFAEDTCTIAFQGGEPTLAGIEFFEYEIELQKKLNIHNVKILNTIQTNGYLLDDRWAEFFAKNHFLVGISLDGPKDIHDQNRLDTDGKGTYTRVMHAVQLLQKHKAEFNVLTVVTASTCKSIRKIYGFFERNKLCYQQYIPCLDPLDEERGGHPYSLTPEKYGQFLNNLFDCWYRDVMDGKKPYNRYFDNLLILMSGGYPEACGMNGVCGRQFVIEADGGVYPCDFYMLDEWKLGNFVTDSFEQIEKRREELRFIQKSMAVHPDCLSCKWKALCRGGCRRDRETVSGEVGKNYFCNAYKQFFEYAYPRLKQLLIMFS